MNALAQSAPTPAAAPVLRQDQGAVAWLTLNRPAQRNALSIGLMQAMCEELERIKSDDAIKVVVVAAAGPGFCAGHDLKELRANPGRQFYEQTFALCSQLMIAITRLPKPVIARVHGIATAAGCQLVATCDLAVATKGAKFATPGVNIGLFCSTPMVALSRNIGRKRSMEMLLTGDMVDADQAQQYGLVNRVVAEDQLDAAVSALAEQIAAKSPLTLAIGKEAFYRQAELDLDKAYAYASEVMTKNMLARDAETGIDAFINKQPQPKWQGR
ncbi:MAG TPA: enoyl-CoA hydratase [Alphaproteobacteria bacterium]|nr:enoyl-CoA hydratase [Alphaproteobacteria bacterium]